MAKIGEMLGLGNNPLYQGFAANRNAFSGAFGGMAANPMNPWGGFAQGAAYGGQQDQLLADQKAAEAKEQEAQNATIEWLQSQGYGDLVQMAQATGDIGAAWTEGLKRSQPKAAQAPIEINGQLVDPVTYEVLGDFRDPQSNTPSAPSGYQWVQGENGTAQLSFIPGGPADPAAQAANKGDTEQTRRARQLATVVNPQMDIVEANFDALADPRNQAASVTLPGGAQPGWGMTTPEYQQASAAIQTIAQSYLYSVSGAAAPAEEVQKLVDSVTPRPFESAQSVADKKARLATMVEAINSMAGGAGQQAPVNGGTLSNGVQWSIGQ